jgi:hypothetical protein
VALLVFRTYLCVVNHVHIQFRPYTHRSRICIYGFDPTHAPSSAMQLDIQAEARRKDPEANSENNGVRTHPAEQVSAAPCPRVDTRSPRRCSDVLVMDRREISRFSKFVQVCFVAVLPLCSAAQGLRVIKSPSSLHAPHCTLRLLDIENGDRSWFRDRGNYQ